ncbi:hypothetical protein JXB01_04580 [Candidatus Micrarchaeota archaeon]|nr:hypothetical protein [Candidatus Micrarchaeota archaeon]
MSSRKGFFFVVISLIVLVYIVGSLTMWTRTISLHEQQISEDFRITNLEFIADQVSEDAIDEFSEISASYALYVLNNHTIEHPVKRGDNAPYSYISLAMAEMMNNGTASGDYFEDGVGIEYDSRDVNAYTFSGFFERLNDTFRNTGVYVGSKYVENFNVSYGEKVDLINVSFDIYFYAEDKNQLASITRSISQDEVISITGLADPAVAREFKQRYEARVRKPIFITDEHPSLYSLFGENDEIGMGTGQGWFYGPVKEAGAESGEENYHHILLGTADEIRAQKEWSSYGAYIIISNETEIENVGLETEKPFIVIDSKELENIEFPQCGKEKCVLFVSENEQGTSERDNPSRMYDIEKLRDAVLCAYYIQDPEGPSYLERLMEKPFEPEYDRTSEEMQFGLSTFLVWNGLNGEIFPEMEYYSRLDREFFNEESGILIRGMPGCKNKEMCSFENEYLGRFRLSQEFIDTYMIEDVHTHIPCNSGWGECEE